MLRTLSESLVRAQHPSESKLFQQIDEKRLNGEELSNEELAYFSYFQNTFRMEIGITLFTLPPMVIAMQ